MPPERNRARAMRADSATDRMKRELHRLFVNIRGDLDRIEILLAALSAFNRPVPDYEPHFRHLWQPALTAQELS